MILRSLLFTALLLAVSVCSAVTPEEEARFLAAVRDAYMKKDKDAIMALTCWDRVTEKHRSFAPKALEYALSRPVKSVQYGTPAQAVPETYTKDGITYGPNLPVTKRIEIDYEDAAGMPHMQSAIYAGEKDGKLLIVNLAPKP